jgi:hypothetical protein
VIPNEETLNRLEESIRRLKIQYDLFFAGVRKLPPTEDRRRLQEFLRELSGKGQMRDNASRFRFGTLNARYNQFQELWVRQMREREEGPMEYRKRAAAWEAAGDKLHEGEPPAPKPAERRAARVTSNGSDSYVTVSPLDDGGAVQEIHQQIAEANRQLGKATAVTLEQLAVMVRKQAEELRSRFKVSAVAFRVETVDGKVKLKAKPIQE